jgi:hypothetical protein
MKMVVFPPAPTGSSREYTAKLDHASGVYTVTFAVLFSEAPSVFVTDYDLNLPAGVDSRPLVASKVYGITPSSFSVMFWEFIQASGGNLNEFVFPKRYFSLPRWKLHLKRKGELGG